MDSAKGRRLGRQEIRQRLNTGSSRTSASDRAAIGNPGCRAPESSSASSTGPRSGCSLAPPISGSPRAHLRIPPDPPSRAASPDIPSRPPPPDSPATSPRTVRRRSSTAIPPTTPNPDDDDHHQELNQGETGRGRSPPTGPHRRKGATGHNEDGRKPDPPPATPPSLGFLPPPPRPATRWVGPAQRRTPESSPANPWAKRPGFLVHRHPRE